MSINHLSGMSSTLYAGNTFFILCTPIWLNSLSHNVLIVYTYISIFQDNTCSHSNSLEGKSRHAKNEINADTSSTAIQRRYLFNCRRPDDIFASYSMFPFSLPLTFNHCQLPEFLRFIFSLTFQRPCRQYLTSGNAALSLLPYLNNCT